MMIFLNKLCLFKIGKIYTVLSFSSIEFEFDLAASILRFHELSVLVNVSASECRLV